MLGRQQSLQALPIDVWKTGGFRRVLLTSDILANSTTVLFLFFGIARYRANLPEDQSIKDIYLGPKHPAFHVYSATVALLASSLGPLIWLMHRPEHYFRHRTALVTGIRLLRLCFVWLILGHGSAAAPAIARISVARALEAPGKSLMIMIGQPMAYYMHHVLYLLPWQVSVLFQLATTCALLHWTSRYPCFLLQAREAGFGITWQHKAEQVCTRMQSYAALQRTALGTPLSEFSQEACTGLSALEVLQIFWILVCLLLVPLAVCYELEHWMKLCYQQQQQQQQSAIASRGSSSSSSDGVQQGSGHSTSGSSSFSSINSLSVGDIIRLTDDSCAGRGFVDHSFLMLFILLLVLPALWLLAEVVAMVFQTHRDCSTVLAASQ